MGILWVLVFLFFVAPVGQIVISLTEWVLEGGLYGKG